MTPAFSHLKTFVKERPNGMYEYSKAAEQIDQLDPEVPMLLKHLKSWEEYDQAIAYIKSFTPTE